MDALGPRRPKPHDPALLFQAQICILYERIRRRSTSDRSFLLTRAYTNHRDDPTKRKMHLEMMTSIRGGFFRLSIYLSNYFAYKC